MQRQKLLGLTMVNKDGNLLVPSASQDSLNNEDRQVHMDRTMSASTSCDFVFEWQTRRKHSATPALAERSVIHLGDLRGRSVDRYVISKGSSLGYIAFSSAFNEYSRGKETTRDFSYRHGFYIKGEVIEDRDVVSLKMR